MGILELMDPSFTTLQLSVSFSRQDHILHGLRVQPGQAHRLRGPLAEAALLQEPGQGAQDGLQVCHRH